MPYAGERSSALGGNTFLSNDNVRDMLERCHASVPDPEPHREMIRGRALDYTDKIHQPVRGSILASDGSRYEATARDDFPSIRCGFLKFGQVFIDIERFQMLRPRSGFVSQLGAAELEAQNSDFGIPLSGAGMTVDGKTPMSTFRQFLFEAFIGDTFNCWGGPLLETLVDLLRRLNRVETYEGRQCVLFQKGKIKCPVTGEPLPQDTFVPIDPGYAPMPHAPHEMLYITDVLRLADVFNEEGENIACYQRAMNVIEHILLAHVLRALYNNRQARSALSNLVILMDGPLSINGEPAVFHRPIMQLVHELQSEFGDDERAPLIMGVAKTGRIVDHGNAIAGVLRSGVDDTRCLLMPIDDEYRYRFIDPGAKDYSKNFGDGTHYGQDFLLRTRAGRMFNLSLAYPCSHKRVEGFQALKADPESYGKYLTRAISVIHMLETPLYENANIAQHLANTYASIAHRPTGNNLDEFLRGIVAKTGAKV